MGPERILLQVAGDIPNISKIDRRKAVLLAPGWSGANSTVRRKYT
jgi:hypothetical protein